VRRLESIKVESGRASNSDSECEPPSPAPPSPVLPPPFRAVGETRVEVRPPRSCPPACGRKVPAPASASGGMRERFPRAVSERSYAMAGSNGTSCSITKFMDTLYLRLNGGYRSVTRRVA
jgi:hypothetical protein